MRVLYFESPTLIVLAAILLIAATCFVTKRIILPLLGIDWPFRRIAAPWRFSLLSITVLVALAAVVLGLCRESIDLSILGLSIILVAWLTVVRYLAFRRSLAEKRHRTFATVLDCKREREVTVESERD